MRGRIVVHGKRDGRFIDVYSNPIRKIPAVYFCHQPCRAADIPEGNGEGEEKSEREREAKAVPQPKQGRKDLSEIAQQLCERGIARSVAVDLANFFPSESITEKIALHDEMKAALDEQFGVQRPLTEEEIEQLRQMAMKTYPETEPDRLAEIRRSPQECNAAMKEILQELQAEEKMRTGDLR